MTENRSKLMVKNTIFLYFRMFAIMCINLVAVRLLLHALGATDYGIYNVVGGVVAMLSFLSSTMASAAQRFYAYHLGKDDNEGLRKMFGVSVTTFLFIISFTVLLAETGGLWLVCNKLVIPAERFDAAGWIYQFSIVTFSINMLCVPFIALVVASERMNFYAIVSIIDAILKLAIIIVIQHVGADKLIMYGGLYMIISFTNLIAYSLFVRSRFHSIRILPMWDKDCFKQIFSYCSWYMFGSVAQVIRSQGINILLNMFFNPVVNAARGLAYQVNSAVSMFVTSFYQAVRPQIIKRYANGELDSMRSLVVNSTKMSYYLVLLISTPLIILMPEVLGLWLKEVPDNTVLFTRLVIIVTMIESLGYPLTTAVCADGNISNFQLVTGVVIMLNLPVSYIALCIGCTPQSTMYIAIGIAAVTHIIRMIYAYKLFQLNIVSYTKMCAVLLSITIVLFLMARVINKTFVISPSILYVFVQTSIILIMGLGIIYSLGMNKSERNFAKQVMSNLFKKKGGRNV